MSTWKSGKQKKDKILKTTNNRIEADMSTWKSGKQKKDKILKTTNNRIWERESKERNTSVEENVWYWCGHG